MFLLMKNDRDRNGGVAWMPFVFHSFGNAVGDNERGNGHAHEEDQDRDTKPENGRCCDVNVQNV